MQIHIARDGQRMGPFSLEEVNRQLAAGTLRLTDQAWYEGASGWAAVSTVPGVSAAAGTSSAPSNPAFTPAPPVYSAAVAQVMDSSPYAGFWIRLLAVIVDSIILYIATFPIKLIFGVSATGLSDSDDHSGANFALAGMGCVAACLQWVIYFLYETLFTSSSMQGTLGKKVCGLKVTDLNGAKISFGKAAGRYFAKILSGIILGIGFIMIAFTERKQGLHDMIVGTYVVKAK